MGVARPFREVSSVPTGTLILLAVAGGILSFVETLYALRTERPFAATLAAFSTFVLVAAVATLGRDGFAEQKIIARLVMPAGLFWLALFGIAALTLRIGHTLLGLSLAFLFVAYTALGSVLLGNVLVRQLERSVSHADPTLRFEAVFVLGGGTKLGPRREPQLGPAGDRLRRAAELWNAGRAERLVASGFSPPPFGLGDIAAHTVSLWEDMGVATASTTTLPGANTSQEMAAYAKLARSKGWRRMGLVSSAWHLPRAMALADRHGLELTALPADHRSGPELDLHPLWLIPQRTGFELVEIAVWENIGRWVGR